MIFTPENIVALVGYVLLFIGSYLTFRDKSEGTEITRMTGNNKAMIDLNTSVDMAMARAMRAETETMQIEARAEARVKALEEIFELREKKMMIRISAAEESLNAFKEYLSYRITFRVKLGPDPTVDNVFIEYYPDRRKESVSADVVLSA